MSSHNAMSPNQREGITALSSITSKNEYVKSTSGALNVAITSGGGSGGTASNFGAAFPATGTAVGAIDIGGNMAGLNLDASGNLKIAGSFSVGGTTDNSAFTAGTSTGTPAMGFYHATIDTVTDGRSATVGITSKRALLVNLNTAAGVEIGTAGSPLRVDVTGSTTQPVSLASTTITGTVAVTQSTSPWVVSNGGTFAVQAAQSGTWNITNISGTITLPTGAATEASLAKLTLAQGSSTSGQSGTLMQGAVTTAAPSYTTTQTSPLSLDITGNLRTLSTLAAGTAVIGHVITDATSVTAATLSAETTKVIGVVRTADGSGNLLTSTANAIDVNIKSGSIANTTFAVTQSTSPWVTSNATTSVVGNGAAATAQRVTLANDSTGVIATVAAVTAITNALPAGTNLLGKVGIDQTTPGTTNLVALTAETTKVIGVVRTADGSGNLLTSAIAEPAAGDRGLETREVGTGLVSTNNSTTSVLAGAAVFTGTADTVTNFASATVTVFTDQVSATDGLSIQQSSNGTNWDITDVYTIPITSAGNAKTFGVQITGTSFRVVYTNGATLQTAFRLQTMFHKNMPNSSSTRPSDGRSIQNDMQEVIGYGSVYDPASTSFNLARQAAGATGVTAVGGLTASGSALAVAPVTQGGLAKTANPTAVADGQVVNALYDKVGRQVTVLSQLRDLITQNVTTITSSTSETTILTAGAASVFHDLTYLKFTNSSATGTLVTIRDATAGTAVDFWWIPANQSVGGVLQVPFKQTTAANNWTAQCTTSVASLYVTIQAAKNV